MVMVMLSIEDAILNLIYNRTTHFIHFIGRLKAFFPDVWRKHYFEDFIEDYDRVYPDRLVFNIFGRRREYSRLDRINYLNHQKFYKFAAQFVKGKVVCDIGCGSGHGCEILKKSGALR